MSSWVCKRKIMGMFAQILEPMIVGIIATSPIFCQKVGIRVVSPIFCQKVGIKVVSPIFCRKVGFRTFLPILWEVGSKHVWGFLGKKSWRTQGFGSSVDEYKWPKVRRWLESWWLWNHCKPFFGLNHLPSKWHSQTDKAWGLWMQALCSLWAN